MFRALLTILTLLTSPIAFGQLGNTALEENRIKIGIIDTGLNVTEKIYPFLCNVGHMSFVGTSPFVDENDSQHGTNIAGLIAEHLDPKKHCLVILKFHGPKMNRREFMRYVRIAIDYSVTINVKYLNLSLGGDDPETIEQLILQEALDEGIKIAVAAGNGRKNRQNVSIGVNLDKKCYYYPACYKFSGKNKDNFHVVGSSKGLFSNKGKVVKYWEDGVDKGTPKLSGTSQATAIHLGKWVKKDSE